jgi:hypothetical protein
MTKKFGSMALLIVCLCALMACGQTNTTTTTTTTGVIPTNEIAAVKDETIYIETNPDGSVESMITVNRLIQASRGLYIDYGRYDSAANLSGTSTILIQDDRLLLPVLEDKDEYFYRATLANGYEAPFLLSIQYLVDGVATVHTVRQDIRKQHTILIRVEVNPNAEETFQSGYLCALQVTLKSQLIRSLNATGGLVVLAGGNTQISLSVLPGSSAEFRIEYEAMEFGISSIQGTITRFDPSFMGSELLGMASSMPLLTEGIRQLALGTEELRQGLAELSDAMHDLSMGSSDLVGGIAQLKAGLLAAANAARQTENALSIMAQSAETLRQGEAGILQAYEGLLLQILDVQATFSVLHSDDLILLTKLAAMTATAQAIQSALEDHFHGMTDFTNGLAIIVGGFGTFADGLDEIVLTISMLESGAEDLSEGLSQLDQALRPLPANVNTVTSALNAIATELESAFSSLSLLFEDTSEWTSYVGEENVSPHSVQFVIRVNLS